MIRSIFDEKKQILRTKFEGEIDLHEIITYIKKAQINSNLPRKLKVLTDSRNSNLLLNPEDLDKVVKANNRSLEEYQYIADAIVLDNPHNTAISYLYAELSKQSNYYFKIFSDFDNAEEWLLTFNPQNNYNTN